VFATLRMVGELAVTAGLVLLLFAAYEFWGRPAQVDARQHELDRQLDRAWAAPPTGVATPSASAAPTVPFKELGTRLWLPKLKKHWVVAEGVAPADIRWAPGHYPASALPGQVGNFAVAGHRTRALFWDLDKLGAGDLVGVQTRDTWYVYQVRTVEIVSPSATEVVAPVPGDPEATPTRKMLTLTTCNPRYHNNQRLIVHAELTSEQPRSSGAPAGIGA